MDPIFKAYDIRGIYPDELDEGKAERISRAFVRYLDAKKLVLGYDARLSSPPLRRSFIKGASLEGAEVTDIGMVGTDVLYFALGRYGYDGGVMITASHNPKEYNGFKLLKAGVVPLSEDQGLPEVASLYQDLPASTAQLEEKCLHREVFVDYVDHVLSFVDSHLLQPMRIVMDAGNGVAGLQAREIFLRLPQVEAIPLNFTPDGNFPNHEPNPQLEVNREQIRQTALAMQADLGIAWDGDGDRCFFIDDRGQFVEGYYVTALLIEAVLRKQPGAKVIFDSRLTWANLETADRFGGIPILSRAGHSFIKARMREEDAVFGGEVSGHYYFRENFYADNGMIPALFIMDLLSVRRTRMSDLLAPLRQKYFISGEINIPIRDPGAIFSKLQSTFSRGRITHIDGLSVEFPAWRFNLRSSQTEPLVRLNVEAKSESLVREMTDQLMCLIHGE